MNWSYMRTRGFSLIELLLVVAIVFVVAGIAIPRMITATEIFRLRSKAMDLNTLLQRARSIAAKANTPVGVRLTDSTFSLVSAASLPEINQMQLVLPSQMSVVGTGMPASLTAATLGISAAATITVADSSSPAYFNARGLPCPYDSGTGTCNSAASTTSYVYYLRDTKFTGSNGWAAVSVSPSGRIKTWNWDGSAWK